MKRFGVNPLSPDCRQQLGNLQGADRENAAQCCNNETTEPGFVQPVIQERAWTSPIWYSPAD
jgi:hypothetical protein